MKRGRKISGPVNPARSPATNAAQIGSGLAICRLSLDATLNVAQRDGYRFNRGSQYSFRYIPPVLKGALPYVRVHAAHVPLQYTIMSTEKFYRHFEPQGKL